MFFGQKSKMWEKSPIATSHERIIVEGSLTPQNDRNTKISIVSI